MYEQLSSTFVQRVVNLMNHLKLRSASTLEYSIAEYNKVFIEAKDNAKFLTTLERHFKNIQINSLAVVKDAIPSLMNALRFVWIISSN